MSVADFQPLYPEDRVLAPLRERAAAVIACAQTVAHADTHENGLLAGLRPVLHSMNSYYTNKIEGQHTRPADIERALRHEYDADSALARKQRLAVAHLRAEEALESAAFGSSASALFTPEWIERVHVELYGRLPVGDRVTPDDVAILPGAFRTFDVSAGNHVAPPHAEVPALLSAWSAGYRTLAAGESLLIGVACAHHRLLWIHPFGDGNGRAARLHTHVALHAMGLTRGVWSPMRGLARAHEAYYARLNNADLPRRNSLDGRGALTQEGLVAFATYLLDICLDQAGFMRDMLAFDGFRLRLRELLLHLEAQPWRIGSEMSTIKPEALEAVHYVALTGPIERSRFLAITGLPSRTARRVLAGLLDHGLLASDGPRAKVRFALPQHALRFLFPRLWPEAEGAA